MVMSALNNAMVLVYEVCGRRRCLWVLTAVGAILATSASDRTTNVWPTYVQSSDQKRPANPPFTRPGSFAANRISQVPMTVVAKPMVDNSWKSRWKSCRLLGRTVSPLSCSLPRRPA